MSEAAGESGSEAGHVLVIGVDGVRFDYLGPDATPAVWRLGQAGFLASVPVDEATPTWSTGSTRRHDSNAGTGPGGG
jgi:hypothetical protein